MPPYFLFDDLLQGLMMDDSGGSMPSMEDEDSESSSFTGSEKYIYLSKSPPCSCTGNDEMYTPKICATTNANTGDMEPKKQVTFDSCGRMRLIKSLKRLTADERASIWMTQEDYQRTQAEAKADIRKLNQEGSDDGCASFSMGVESVDRYQQRRVIQAAATQAVLREQTTQHRDGYSCENLIAMVYEQYSDIARARAHLAGVMMRIESQS